MEEVDVKQLIEAVKSDDNSYLESRYDELHKEASSTLNAVLIAIVAHINRLRDNNNQQAIVQTALEFDVSVQVTIHNVRALRLMLMDYLVKAYEDNAKAFYSVLQNKAYKQDVFLLKLAEAVEEEDYVVTATDLRYVLNIKRG